MNKNNKRFYLDTFKNIVRNDGNYVLEEVYKEDQEKELCETEENLFNPNCNQLTKNCYRCIHSNNDYCLLRSKLENLPEYHYMFHWTVNKCDAYSPVYPLNIIKSKDDMIDFIIKVENFFGSPEDYENYFGFIRYWNEDTGDILETVREYYARGGVFENIPDKYPCVINFSIVGLNSIRTQDDKLDWIYIGDLGF